VRRSLIWTAVALFFAFEASRAIVMISYLGPLWERQVEAYRAITAGPVLVSVICLTAVAIAFVAPMSMVVFGLWKLHKRLSRNGTVVNSLLTKLNFR
jgi:hypothetical protein